MKCILKSELIFFTLLLFLTSLLRSEELVSAGFVENKGQIMNQSREPNEEVLFLYTGAGIRIQLRKTGYSYEFFKVENFPVEKKMQHSHSGSFMSPSIRTQRVDVGFKGVNANAIIEREGQSTSYLNYVIDGKETSNVYSWKKIKYKDVYKHIDIEFMLTGNEKSPLKYNLILHPGAKMSDIRFLIEGAILSVDGSSGNVNLSTDLFVISENIPFSFYGDEPNKNRQVKYLTTGNELSFAADYDTARTFIIDPISSLQWGTFFGGSSLDVCTATACDALNNVYTAGYALSTNNIATTGAYQTVQAGNFDAFVAKFNSAGIRLWGTFFGGSSFDLAYAMCVEANGNVYITGDTFSPGGISSTGAYQTSYGGGIDDVMLAKFNTSGQRIWSTYFGGSDHDIAQAIALDKFGDVVITGHSSSPAGIATAGAYSTFCNLNYDVFVAKFSSAGARVWGSYYGDSGADEGYGITSDTLGNVYVTGGTTSIAYISSSGAHQVYSGGSQDAFITCFNKAGSMVIWGTYYGGSGNDFGTAIEARNTTIFLAGTTTSTNNISSVGAFQPAISSADDSFLSSFTTLGTRNWGSYFGGEDVDYINDIFLDPKSNVLFCGSTMSSYSISTPGAFQPSIATIGNYDAYFAIFSPSGQRKSASYYGGEGNDIARGLTLDNLGKLYLTGETTSTLGISTTGAHMVTPGGNTDGFLAKFCVPFQPSIFPAGTATVCKGTITLSATSGYANYVWSNSVTTNPLIVNIFATGNYYFYVTASDAQNCKGSSDSTRISVLACLSIDELSKSSMPLLYPSPVEDMVSVKLQDLPSGSRIEIHSIMGTLISVHHTTEVLTKIDVHDLAPGFYLLSVNSEAVTSTQKFVKK